MRPLPCLSLLSLLACAGADKAASDDEGVLARVDPSLSESFFDSPWPSDDRRLASGLPDLDGYPTFGSTVAQPIVAGWARRLGLMAQGFGNNTAAYFRFEGPLSLPDATLGEAGDPVLLIDMETGERLPLTLRFVEDPLGDPYWAPNTLAFAPTIGHPPRSGATLAAVVMRSAGARAPSGYALPAGVEAALALSGVSGEAAVATVYTVQDVTDQLQQLMADVDARLGAEPDWGLPSIKRVVQLEFKQGTTASGEATTQCVATFEDGSTDTTELGPLEENGDHIVDLGEDWPMVVYQLSVPLLNYSGLDDRPYMRPGFGTLQDADRDSGWIDFAGGLLTAVPDTEWVRVTLSLPKGPDGNAITGAPLVIWDHGTGGQAWEPVQRRNGLDRGKELSQRLQEAGVAILGHDAPLYGQRYPLIDEGYGDMLGFYNIVNLPAFRDNQRQVAVESHTLYRFVETALNDWLPAGSVDPNTVWRGGHSMGSVTANLGLAADPDRWQRAFLSGTGGVFAHYFLDTGLISDFDPALLASLFALFGAEAPETITAPAALGAALGLPEEAWSRIDRLHPAITLFQWTMDPSDPMAVARDEALPVHLFLGVGDRQVPNFTSEALEEALPEPTTTWCTPTTDDYDPHVCLHREETGQTDWAAWLNDR